MKDRRIVVTGLGAITPIGNDVPSFWNSLVKGQGGVGTVTRFDIEPFETKIAAEVKGFIATQHIEPKEARHMDLFTQYGVVAADEAIKDSGLTLESESLDRIGVIVGSGIGGMIVYDTEHRKLIEKGPRRISPFFIPMMIPDIVPGHISIKYNLKGPNYSSVSACASGAQAIGLGMMHIQRGDTDIMIVGGTEGVITPMAFAGFSNSKALSARNDDPSKAARPFDKERDGFVIGEGAGIVVLEELEHAKKRGARIYAEFSGLGFTGDAYHITAPHPEGDGQMRAMRLAVADAGLSLDKIDYVNAHGTSTPLNDKTETLAIKTAFGEHAKRLQISSNKSMIGHLLGASGAVEFIATALTLNRGVIPPTINYTVPDPDCDLDYVPNEARQSAVQSAISNSFGFGGHNVSLCLTRFNG